MDLSLPKSVVSRRKTISLEPTRLSVMGRRLIFICPVIFTVFAISLQLWNMFKINGLNPLKLVIFVLFVSLLIPLLLSIWTAILGFLIQWRGGDELDLSKKLEPLDKDLILPRTAVVMPVYNEDPVRVFAGLKATYESLEQTGFLSHFTFFVLSDTTDPDVWIREELAFSQLQAEVSDPRLLVYRNRRQNLERKSGNIADFCATWGNQFRYMIVFDADSLMSGLSLVNLVRVMEKHPQVGIVQAPPLPVNLWTLFGRVHQFAMRAYSTIFISGLNFWQGGAGNYWGHNAIIRIAPFVEHCRLPKLSGKEPLGGSILSHDFVEAAYMRRAGWKVYLASELGGSYEEMPGSLIGYAARDRRWCQGNLQHARLLLTPRFHWVNRLHLWMGVMAYLASPLWLILLALTTIEGIKEHLGKHRYFESSQALFPTWPISVQHQAITLFLLMMALLLLPKILSLIVQFRKSEGLAGFGGGLKLILSSGCETIFSTLLAPNLALLQARFVFSILLGKNVKWEAQDRGQEGTSLREAFRRHWQVTALGLAWTALLLLTVPRLVWWFSPVLAGFLLAIPLSAWSSRTSAGKWTFHRGLFLTPEEIAPPQLLQRLHQELAQASSHPWAQDGDGLKRILEDDAAWQTHLSLLSPPSSPKNILQLNHLHGLELKVSVHGAQSLTRQEKRELLLDSESLQSLKHQLKLLQSLSKESNPQISPVSQIETKT